MSSCMFILVLQTLSYVFLQQSGEFIWTEGGKGFATWTLCGYTSNSLDTV